NAQVPCTPGMLAMAKSLGRGMGGAGCSCGALTGGVMALGALLGGKSKESDNLCKALTLRYHNAFKEANGATCCRVLHRGLAFGSAEQIESCARRTENAARILAQVIADAEADIKRL
ncbi:MAG: C_GCAxxG_C_C family protein, partial [Mailhella sp.]|nr:C_GCAxxG_C_C family protein [Mailhella sp.]